MKRSAKVIVRTVLGLVVTLILLITANAVRSGLKNAIIQDEWRQVEDHWSNKDSFEGIKSSLQVSWMTIDCGIRTTISEPYFHRAVVLESQGKYKQALDVCMIGARLIGAYDPEGVIGYQCVALEMRHHILFPANNSSAPILSPTLEP